MEKEKLDLWDRTIANGSRNKTALISFFAMNMVFVLAYFLEVIKDVRSFGSYAIVASCCIIPSILCLVIYKIKKDSMAIRYIMSFGFLLFYAYTMMTASTELVFCYVIAFFMSLIVFADFKISILLSVLAVLVNIVYIISKALSGNMQPQDITNAEIMIMSIVLTFIFALSSINKILRIDESVFQKAEMEKENSVQLLGVVQELSSYITDKIQGASKETDDLKRTIDTTGKAMEQLAEETDRIAEAMGIQKDSVENINGSIQIVEEAVFSIREDIKKTENNLEQGNVVMVQLLQQVEVSEEAREMVMKEMDVLRGYANKMQDIVSLIGSVAGQTSLLSLNASIEASRAGEAGRGFSVVATEISNLADQTNRSTGDIQSLIKDITDSIEEVSKTMDVLLESGQKQNEYANNAAESFQKISRNTHDIATQSHQLEQSVEIVSKENRQVMEKIEDVSLLTREVTEHSGTTLESCQENRVSIDNVTAIMSKLEEEAQKLQTT